jgi:hypothetical protein
VACRYRVWGRADFDCRYYFGRGDAMNKFDIEILTLCFICFAVGMVVGGYLYEYKITASCDNGNQVTIRGHQYTCSQAKVKR